MTSSSKNNLRDADEPTIEEETVAVPTQRANPVGVNFDPIAEVVDGRVKSFLTRNKKVIVIAAGGVFGAALALYVGKRNNTTNEAEDNSASV